MLKKVLLASLLLLLVGFTVYVMLMMDEQRNTRNEAAVFAPTSSDSVGNAEGYLSRSQTEKLGAPNPAAFSGEYYHGGLGYVFRLKNHARYGLTYDRRHLQMSDYPATLVRAGDSIVFEVSKALLNESTDIESYLETYLLAALYEKEEQKPEVSYNYQAQCGWFSGYHRYYGEDMLCRAYTRDSVAFVAMLRYPRRLAADSRVQELKEAVNTFQLVK